MNKFFTGVILAIMLLGFSCKKEEIIIIKEVEKSSTIPSFSGDSLINNKYRILILMYHKLTNQAPYDLYERNAVDFENDLNFIASRGYQVLSFDDLIKVKAGTLKLQNNAVVISFDDGHESDFSIAYPKLKQKEMPATFFMVSNWVGEFDRVTWSNISEMHHFQTASGQKLFSIESHSRSHPFLARDSADFPTRTAYLDWLNDELKISKDSIQKVTGQLNMWLALPYGNGANDPTIISAAKKCGYSGIRTSIFGSFTAKTLDPFALPSLPILSVTDISEIDNYMP